MGGERDHVPAESSRRARAATDARAAAPAPIASESMGNRAALALLRAGAQRKARIGSPADPRESEADRAAEAATSRAAPVGPLGAAGDGATPRIQRAPNDYDSLSAMLGLGPARPTETASAPAPQGLGGGLAGGRKLDEDLRAQMERSFGVDFSGVRLHSGPQAAESADRLDARAYTIGEDIVFAAGEFAPQTGEGRRLLAHELAHVVQQRRGAAGAGPAAPPMSGVAAPVLESAAPGGVQKQERPVPSFPTQQRGDKPFVSTSTGFGTNNENKRVIVAVQRGGLRGGAVASGITSIIDHPHDDGGEWDAGTRIERIKVFLDRFATLQKTWNAGAVVRDLAIKRLIVIPVEDGVEQAPIVIEPAPPKPVPHPPQPRPPVAPPPGAGPPLLETPPSVEQEPNQPDAPWRIAQPEQSSAQAVRDALERDPAAAARLAGLLTDDDFRSLSPDERDKLLRALTAHRDEGDLDVASVIRLLQNTPDDQTAALQKLLDANRAELALDLALYAKGEEGRQLNMALMDVWTRSRIAETPPSFALSAPPAPAGEGDIHWLGRPPDWAKDMKYWKGPDGHTNVWTPQLGLSSWDASGRRLGLTPGAPELERTLRAMAELQRTGGKRFVAGKGLLDEGQWREHVDARVRERSVEAARRLDFLAGDASSWDATQRGVAYLASGPAHLLGGRGFDEPAKIVAGSRQDVAIALHQMQQARTTEELDEANRHLDFALAYGGHRLTGLKDDVELGAERTITGIKVGAVVATAYVSAPAIFAAGGGAGIATMGLGGKLALVGGTGLGTGLLTGTMGGALEVTHRGASWENYGRGFVDYAPVGLTYGLGFGAGAAFNAAGGFGRGVAIEATTSSLSGMADRGLHGGSWSETGAAGLQGLFTGGAMGAFSRGLNLRSPLSHFGFNVGTATGLAWLGGADNEEIYRQGLLAGAMTAGGLFGHSWAPSRGPARAQWWRVRLGAAALRAGVAIHEIPGLSGRAYAPSLPRESLPALTLESHAAPRAGAAAPELEVLAPHEAAAPQEREAQARPRGETFESEEAEHGPPGPVTGSLPGLEVRRSQGLVVLGAGDPFLNDAADFVRPEPGFHDVHAHSRPQTSHETVSYVSRETGKSVRITADILNQVLRENGVPDGAPVRLFACSSGLFDSGVAAQLAKLRKGFVLAPSVAFGVNIKRGTVGTRSKLDYKGETYRLFGPGGWRLFAPDGKVTPVPDYEAAANPAHGAEAIESAERRAPATARESEEVEQALAPRDEAAPEAAPSLPPEVEASRLAGVPQDVLAEHAALMRQAKEALAAEERRAQAGEAPEEAPGPALASRIRDSLGDVAKDVKWAALSLGLMAMGAGGPGGFLTARPGRGGKQARGLELVLEVDASGGAKEVARRINDVRRKAAALDDICKRKEVVRTASPQRKLVKGGLGEDYLGVPVRVSTEHKYRVLETAHRVMGPGTPNYNKARFTKLVALLLKQSGDHVLDLQLSGLDDIGNIWLFDRATNEELGRQIHRQLAGVPYGTRITGVRWRIRK